MITPRFSAQENKYKIMPPKNTEEGNSLKWGIVDLTLDIFFLSLKF